MKNRFCLKRTWIIISAVAFLTAGTPGLSTITAWALPSTATVVSSTANVRASAVDGDVVDVLTQNMEADVIDSTTGSDGMTWYEIRYTSNGSEKTGWIRSDLVDAPDDSESEAAELAAQQEAEQQAAEEAERAAAEEAAREAEQQAAEEAARQQAEEEVVAASEGGITYVIASAIPASVIPEGFRKTNVDYEGNEIQALVMENAEDVYLLYMEDASGMAEGRFVVYDIDRAELIPYIRFETQDGYILLLNIPDSELSGVSDRFSLTTCEFDTGTMDALQMTQTDDAISESVNLSDLYYMYGVDHDGVYGWYVYDKNTESVQENVLNMRYNLNGTVVEVEEEEEEVISLDSLSMIVIIGILVILLLLVILVIIFGVRYRRLAKQYDAAVNGTDQKRGKRQSHREKKKAAEKEEQEEDDFYFDDEDEDDDDSVFSRSIDDLVSMSEQRTRPVVPETTQSFNFESERQRILNEGATEPLRSGPQVAPQPAKSSQQTNAQSSMWAQPSQNSSMRAQPSQNSSMRAQQPGSTQSAARAQQEPVQQTSAQSAARTQQEPVQQTSAQSAAKTQQDAPAQSADRAPQTSGKVNFSDTFDDDDDDLEFL